MTKIVIASLAVAAGTAVAQADLITAWNFNNIPAIATANTPASLGITSIASTAGSVSGNVSLTNWLGNIDDFGGSSVGLVGADAAGASLSLLGGGTTGNYPGNGSTITFTTSFTGAYDPLVSFATQRTTTGFNSIQFAWSTDGVNFTDFGSPYTPAAAYAGQSFNLSSVDALDGAASVTFRLTFNGASSTSGNNRIDNIQINASTPTPGAAALLTLGLAAAGRRRRA